MKGSGEKPAQSSSINIGTILRLTLRLFQFVMGIVVIGLYAQDLKAARDQGKYVDSKWVWATFVGALSSFLAVVFSLPLIKSWWFFWIDALVWFFWLVVFGIFGKMYIKEDPEGNKGIIRMKRAVWIDLVNLFLWLISACYGAFIFWKARKARSQYTGRAQEHVV
ncbi:hypothetical protein CC78DRAFT_553644 [Lojkania enalia]|uniref:MARVEL domain-containing protein n=1 Tax=Lojkania enalia TaxID=147567 RepID=A0A9P4N371_9PLEO|nr:hypothetical protein CC78DRAFT_553644 [Didymosphaeria enalia]